MGRVVVENEDRLFLLEAVGQLGFELLTVLEELHSFCGSSQLNVVVLVSLTQWQTNRPIYSGVPAPLSSGVVVRILLGGPRSLEAGEAIIRGLV